jgi:hypothetical protein
MVLSVLKNIRINAVTASFLCYLSILFKGNPFQLIAKAVGDMLKQSKIEDLPPQISKASENILSDFNYKLFDFSKVGLEPEKVF